MRRLAMVLKGQDRFLFEDNEDIRLMGYAASLVKGTVSDAEGRLIDFISFCQEHIDNKPYLDVTPRDPVQARWKSPWHLDCQKLRQELPLYVQQI